MFRLPARSRRPVSFLILAGLALLLAVAPVGAATRAVEVVDRTTLQDFVEYAVTFAEQGVCRESGICAADDPYAADAAYGFFDRNFRPRGDWNEGPIYLFIYELTGTNVFHAAQQRLEGQNLWELRDRAGLLVIQELVRQARSGGGFVDYYWENPEVDGDEELGSFKVGYAKLLSVGDRNLMIGSGFYPADPVPVFPAAALALLGFLAAGSGCYWVRRRR